MTVRPHHLTLSNLFKGSLSYSLACKMDLSLGFNRGGIEGGLEERRESECVCVCVGVCGGPKGEKRGRSKLPPCQSKNLIIILNQHGKDTKSPSHTMDHWSRPEQLLHN